ncbi:lytic transglycosylase domain-containing protein [Streptomyces solisilvae]|uniref:lytic transglycosylase domain-containing protein n=2 Tax=Streptomyces TaxID=1883 RepID=UPI0036CE3335
MADQAKRRWWPAVPLIALALWFMTREAPSSSDAPSASPGASEPGASRTAPAPSARPRASYDPADYARPVRAYAAEAGVSARLLMAILYNESYKPHDPKLERAWQRYKPEAAFGIANMHRAAFDATKRGRDFAHRRWEELPDDRGLAIEAAAWHLHDLAAQLPARRSGACTRDELLALGYNTGASNMLAFARGVTPGNQAQSYLDRLRNNWGKAGSAVAR